MRRTVAGEPLTDVAVWSNFAAAALILSLGRVRDERYHGAVTLGIAGLFLLFLVLGALRIG